VAGSRIRHRARLAASLSRRRFALVNLLKHIHEWLIKKVVGSRPVIANVQFTRGVHLAATNKDVLEYNNSFAGATFYVNAEHGDDANDGLSMSSPFATVKQACRVIDWRCRDMVIVQPGKETSVG
jgi:hypothetical protein